MFRDWIKNIFYSLKLRNGPFRLSKWNRIKTRCFNCGGHIPKGRHYNCSIGCKIEYKKGLRK